ncbi:MAG: tyrosine-type recombinase/integrase [Terriglobia bacterium]
MNQIKHERGLRLRGKIWHYRFQFCGQWFEGSTHTASKTVARAALLARKAALIDSANNIKRQRVQLFSLAATEWLDAKRPHLAPRSVEIETANLKHLLPVFGGKLTIDITPANISNYQAARQTAGAAAKTINLEIGTLRAIMRKNRLWANLQPDVKMLRVSDDVGQAITHEQETALLKECVNSRSRSLYPAVSISLATGMRYGETRLLTWRQIDFASRMVWVGKSKTKYGDGRQIPMNDRAFQVMSLWASNFPNRQGEHYVFPSEKYGASGDGFTACFHSTDPTKPIGDWKEAWEAARKRAKVHCRWHDLRHTACTRMLEAGAPFSVVASLMGWSTSSAIRMAQRYGHIGQAAQREAVKALEAASPKLEPTPNAEEVEPKAPAMVQ